MQNKKQTMLIAGGAGFLGSHFIDYILELGYNVICVDNLLTGSKKNIEHLCDNENFKFIKYDIIQPLSHCEELKATKQSLSTVDYILNLASPASPVDYYKYPIETLNVGSIGTKNLLDLAKEKNAVFLLTSTSEVYGDPKEHPQKETYWGNVNSIGMRSMYDEAKRFAEALTMAYHRKYNLDTKIVRIFNTYGPRMRLDDGRVVPNFISQALNNEDFTIYGDGAQTRSFCYVQDEIEGIYKLLMSKENDPINIGNPFELKIIDFAEKIKKLTNSESKIIYKDLPMDDPKLRQPDISKAKELLNWDVKVSLDEGLKKTIDWFKK
jgi:dTDP-glucose 4,6-dehydratase